MNTDLLSLWGAIQRGDTLAIASQMFPPSADTAHKPLSQGQKDVPHAGLGSVEAGFPEDAKLRLSQQRQTIYGHERLIEKLYDLLPGKVDEAYDLVRAAYLEIHGD